MGKCKERGSYDIDRICWLNWITSPSKSLNAFAAFFTNDDPIDACAVLEDASDDIFHQIEILYEVSRQIFRL